LIVTAISWRVFHSHRLQKCIGTLTFSGGKVVRIAKKGFSEAHQYEHAVRAANVRGFSTVRGKFSADLLQLDLDQLWLQSGAESLPRSAHVIIPLQRSPIFFLANSQQAALQTGGADLVPGQIAFYDEGSSHDQKTQRGTRWASMSLSPEDPAVTSADLIGPEIKPPHGVAAILAPDAASMARLTALHADARQLAEDAPGRLAHPEVSRALESALTHAMVHCLADAPSAAPAASHLHTAIMARFERLIAQNPGLPLYLTEVCKKVGASERTLRRCCQEHLGMGPNRYLLLRRMHLARKALIDLDQARTTVTEVATRFGFWELGRFAGAYRAIFGESPAATLKRPAEA
jgi:AraC-like DNA-binding protein